jgi:hypothetical protein
MKNSMILRLRKLFFCLFLAGTVAALPLTGHSAATITILNGDGAGEGFNDPTPVAPVGGNPGTTLGQQRLNAFQVAANIWGAQLTSVPAIIIHATFDPLSCNATSAVLGSAGPISVWLLTGAPFSSTWYPAALANALVGADLDTSFEIRARFNSNLGQTGCLTGVPFYLGFDNNHGTDIDLVTVLLHEFAHGLGFFTAANGTTGAFLLGLPSVYDRFILDLTTSKTWVAMTDAERAASAINPRKVVWTGANVTTNVPATLQSGTPRLNISSPPSVLGIYLVGTASFGPALTSPGVTGQLMPITGTVADPLAAQGCNPLAGANALAANGNIVLIDRGTCTFVTKVKNAQNAGAIGVVIAENAPGSPPSGLGGSDPTITIPSVRITQEDGNTLKNALRFRSRTRSGVIATLDVNLSQRAGADAIDRALLYTPNPLEAGSSVTHWDTIATPNLLMEPFINADLTHDVIPPGDLTLPLLKDIGWP